MFALSSSKNLLLSAICAMTLAAIPATAFAQDSDDPPPEAGRISYISGNVSIQPVTSDEWGQAYPNLPVGPGDRIFTDSDGRAEIQVGRTYVRIGPNSDVTLVDDSQFNINFGIAQGSVRLHSYGLWPRQLLDVSTPNGNAEFEKMGDLRVDVLPNDGATVFTNLGDFADITAAGNYRQELDYGQSLELAGSNPVYPQWLQPAGPDDLDSWSGQRDQQLSRVTSFQYVSPDIPGAADLDQYGDWQPATEYGAVWFPRDVSSDWQPYHNGHWIDRQPWGWTWVEDESWGYAPFHYGRWVSYNGRWGWVPGPVNVRPVYSPALVVFAGGGNIGGGLSVWIPLGPGEAYRPWYKCSPRYIDRVNITNIRESQRVHVQNTYVNVVNVTNVTYVNQSRGASAMRRDDFASGRSMRNVAVKVDQREIQNARPIPRPEVNPTPRAIVSRPVSRPVPVSVQRPNLINQQGRQIEARPNATPVAPPVRQQPQIRQIPGRTVVAAPAPPPAGHQGRDRSLGNPGNQNQRPNNQPGQQTNQQQNQQPNQPYPGGVPRGNPVAPGQGVQRPLQPGNQNQPNQPGDNNDRRQAPGAPFGRPTPPATPPTYQQQGQPNPGQNPNGVTPNGRPVAPPDNRRQDRPDQRPNQNVPQPAAPGVQPNGRPVAPPDNRQQDRPDQRPNQNVPQPAAPGVQPNGRPVAPPDNRQQDRPDQRPNQNVPQPAAPGVQPNGRPTPPPSNNQQPGRPNYQQDRPNRQPEPPVAPPQQPQNNRQDFGPVQPNRRQDQVPPPANNNPPQGRPVAPPPQPQQPQGRPVTPPPQQDRNFTPPQQQNRPAPPPRQDERQSRPTPPPPPPPSRSADQPKPRQDQQQNRQNNKDDKKKDDKDKKPQD